MFLKFLDSRQEGKILGTKWREAFAVSRLIPVDFKCRFNVLLHQRGCLI